LVNIPDPRGNGQTLPVYNLSRAKLGLINELDTNSDQNRRVYKGVDVSVNLRLPGGGTLYGGTSTGRTLYKTCQNEDPNLVGSTAGTTPGLRFCDYNQYDVPFQTLFKLAGTYPLPLGVRLSGNFQHTPGSERIIVYSVDSKILPTLVQASVNVRLNEPGTVYNDSVNQLDFSLNKTIRSGGIELRPEVSFFNVLNANPVLTQVNAFGPLLNNATTILAPRLTRFGLTVKF
jgi:hypothetical protein